MSDNNAILKKALKLVSPDKNESFISELASSINATLEKKEGEQSAHVHSAMALSNKQKSALEQILTTQFERKQSVTYHVDKDLLGGFKVSVGDWVFDATLDRKLKAMKQLFAR